MPVPFGLTAVQFQARYERSLERHAAQLIAALRELFSRALPASVDSAEVQIFLGEDGREVPSAWIYFNGKNNRVDANDTTLFAGRAMDLGLVLTGTHDVDERYFDRDQFDGIAIVADTTCRWFAECWWKAGGWNYPIPVQVNVHDGFGNGRGIVLTEAVRC